MYYNMNINQINNFSNTIDDHHKIYKKFNLDIKKLYTPNIIKKMVKEK
jgi:hypothetical protein